MIFDTKTATLEMTADEAFIMMQNMAFLLRDHYTRGQPSTCSSHPITMRDGKRADGSDNCYADSLYMLIERKD